MPDRTQDELLAYYLEELAYLRERGSDFARSYPKVAGRLELGDEESRDPHVERLLESFAYLTARIRRNLDQQFPEITTALLDNLYPHYLRPVPSLTVARFDADPEQGRMTSGHLISEGTSLFAESENGVKIRFRTCYPVTLWPLRVTRVALESTDQFEFLDRRPEIATVLRVRIESLGAPFEQLDVDTLRFYLNAEPRTAGSIYELLFTRTLGVALIADDGRPRGLPSDTLRPVGFGPDEGVLPQPEYAHPAYRMLQEYFAFPRKYHFADVSGLGGRASGSEIDLLFLLDRIPHDSIVIGPETFALGCTPIINLFRKTSEPIRLDHRRVEYRAVPDMRRQRSTEIHSVRRVSAFTEEENTSYTVQPYYALEHEASRDGASAFWHARRVPTATEERPGTDLYLTFVDLNLDPSLPPVETVYAHTDCTNRGLAEEIPAGAALQIEEAAPLSRIRVLHKPTRQLDPPLGGQTPWRLVSHLTLNHLSLEGGEAGLRSLREILRLYGAWNEASVHRQIMGIRDLECRPVTRRLSTEAWRGFCRGTEVAVELDEDAYTGTNAFLFASVLRHFFGLYAPVNAFTQLVLRSTRRDGEWYRWRPLAGARELV